VQILRATNDFYRIPGPSVGTDLEPSQAGGEQLASKVGTALSPRGTAAVLCLPFKSPFPASLTLGAAPVSNSILGRVG